MERIKNTLYSYHIVMLILILFFIPFFWFHPGEVNLGGDSSRLYFYDPLNYLKNYLLYSIVPSDLGNENLSYSFIPFTVFLLILKYIINNVSLLISFFHGLELSMAFLFTYLIVKNLLTGSKVKNVLIQSLASIAGGFFYIFNPILSQGWTTAVISQNQLFLNPLIFYLLFKFFRDKKDIYFYSIILIVFIFSPNFGYASAPAIFSFYPFSIVFLLLYTKLVLEKSISFLKLFFFFLLFLGVNAFHIIPQALQLLSTDSAQHQNVFTTTSQSSAESYFEAISSSIKLTNNIIVTYQTDNHVFTLVSILSFIFPLIIVLGFYLNKKNEYKEKNLTFLLLGIWFLLLLFFDTANITNLGVTLYALFYKIPGFVMFRNYYGQFVYVFYFFYALIFSFGLYYVLTYLKKLLQIITYCFCIICLLIIGYPMITGEIPNRDIYQSKNIKEVFIMDPRFEEILKIVRTLPIEGKIIDFPLSAYGYQVIAGVNGGVYKGPSMLGYLTGKKDFTGYGHAGPYSDMFLDMISNKNYTGIKNLFALLNIKYIYYDSNNNIYDTLRFPYDFLKNKQYFPNQKSIGNFIKHLGVDKLIERNNYSLYSIHSPYLPHIYTPNTVYQSGSQDGANFILENTKIDGSYAIDSNSEQQFLLKINNIDQYTRINKYFPFPVTYPYAKWGLTSLIYPLTILKEENRIRVFSSLDSGFIDANLFFAAKRIAELDKWGKDIPVDNYYLNFEDLSRSKESKSTNTLIKNYNSWNISILRYFDLVQSAIERVNNTNQSLAWKLEQRSKLRESIIDNKDKFSLVINEQDLTEKDRKYLTIISYEMFSRLLSEVEVKQYDPHVLEYYIDISKQQSGEYQLLLKKSEFNNIDLSKSSLVIDKNIFQPLINTNNQEYIDFGTIMLTEGSHFIYLNINRENLAKDSASWKGKDQLIQDKNSSEVSLQIFSGDDLPGGILNTINGLKENSSYLLSFDYNTHGNIFEMSTILSNGNTSKKETLFRERKISGEWEKMNIFIDSKNFDSVTLLARSTPSSKSSKMDIKNLSLYQLPIQPELVLKKVTIPTVIYSPPTITFSRVNPTKYYVHVENVSKDYMLVLLDSYNKNWKLFLADDAVFPNVRKYTSTYFNGAVKEERHENIFLNKNSFETWNKKPIAESTHQQINSYANGWIVHPDETKNKKSYTLVIEMTNERIFYMSILISACSLFITMLLFVNSLIRKNTMNTNRFGGERLDSKSKLSRNNLLEHLARYEMVNGIKNGKILDVGCGTGHGSNLLASKFKEVVGIDISKDAISYAKKYWKTKNTDFISGSALSLPFKANTFDAVAAFEIIEHLHEFDIFLSELERVVKPKGKIYISTPNKDIYSPMSKTPINPHHVFEWKIPEFKNVLKKYFTINEFYGMRTPVYNDHWIWKIVDPILFTFHSVIPYTVNNRIKLTIINWIKPELDKNDIVFSSKPDWVKKSRFMLAICTKK